MTDLDEISRLLAKATPGPWKVYRFFPHVFEICNASNYATGPVCTTTKEANSYLIAALRNAAEELVRDARLLREAEELGRYGNDDGARDWVTAGTWLYPGDRIVVVRGESEQREAP